MRPGRYRLRAVFRDARTMDAEGRAVAHRDLRRPAKGAAPRACGRRGDRAERRAARGRCRVQQGLPAVHRPAQRGCGKRPLGPLGRRRAAARAATGFPIEVALHPRGGFGLVHDERYIRHVDASGTISTTVELDQPTALAYDAAGNLFVSELGGRVQRIGTDGSRTTYAGFNQPHGLAVAPDGSVVRLRHLQQPCAADPPGRHGHDLRGRSQLPKRSRTRAERDRLRRGFRIGSHPQDLFRGGGCHRNVGGGAELGRRGAGRHRLLHRAGPRYGQKRLPASGSLRRWGGSG